MFDYVSACICITAVQQHGIKYFYQLWMILLHKSVWHLDETLTGPISVQSGPGSNGNEVGYCTFHKSPEMKSHHQYAVLCHNYEPTPLFRVEVLSQLHRIQEKQPIFYSLNPFSCTFNIWFSRQKVSALFQKDITSCTGKTNASHPFKPLY